MRFNAMLAALALLIGCSSYLLAQSLDDCIENKYSSFNEGACDKSAGTKCQTLASGVCADWNEGADPPKPSQKKWITNNIVGTCGPKKGSEYSDCPMCTLGVYCAWGKKYANLEDCQATQNPIAEIWGYCAGVCTTTMY